MSAMKSAATQLTARINMPILVSQKFLATDVSLEISKAEHIGH